MTLKEPEEKDDGPPKYNPWPVVSPALVTKILGHKPDYDFKMADLIKTSQDETVFSRINPHIPSSKSSIKVPENNLAQMKN